MPRRHRSSRSHIIPTGTHNAVDERARPLIQGWMAEVLAFPGVWSKNWCPHEEAFRHTELLQAMGLNLASVRKRKTPPPRLLDMARQMPLESLLAEDEVFQNLTRLAERIRLSVTEQRLLALVCHMHGDGQLGEAFNLIEHPARVPLFELLARMIRVGPDEVEHALRADGLLCSTQLLEVDLRHGHHSIQFSLQINDELSSLAHRPDVPDHMLTGLFFRMADKVSLTQADYVHVSAEVTMLQGLLADALRQQRRGVNVLIHGTPGTGKSALASVLARELGAELAVIPETDRDGDPLGANTRLGRLNACQQALGSHTDTLILFDEAEDSLCYGEQNPFMPPRRPISKASLTRVLEDNRRPVIWISNDVRTMDPALQRRFDHLMRLDNPGPVHRLRVVNKYLGDVPVSADFRQQLADLRELSPAMIEAAVSVARRCTDEPAELEGLIARNLEGRLDALGSSARVQVTAPASLPWRGECLRASEDVHALIRNLAPDSNARFCLYGPPGTGKTAWARQLARQLGRPLIVRQASDLLGPFVGMTEWLIAAAFREAEREQAVLLIDEADSFLANRRQASQDWEVTEVNQFLASMEQYQGLFIATTNLLERIDEAAMRRFDFRVRFNYLDAGGIALLLTDLGEDLGLTLPGRDDLCRMVADLDRVAPGDIAALHRRLRVRRDRPEADALVAMLREECSYKQPGSRPIGFAAALH